MEREAFEREVRAAAQTLYRVACAYLNQPSDRDDAVQEALVRAWEKRRTLREERYFRTWLVRILIRVCVDMRKAKGRTTPLDSVPERAAPETPRTALREAIDALEPPLRVAVVLHYIEGYDTREVAGLLRIPQGTVKSRLSRARKRMQNILKEEMTL